MVPPIGTSFNRQSGYMDESNAKMGGFQRFSELSNSEVPALAKTESGTGVPVRNCTGGTPVPPKVKVYQYRSFAAKWGCRYHPGLSSAADAAALFRLNQGNSMTCIRPVMIRLAAAAALLMCAGLAQECGAQTRPATKPATPPPTSRPAMPPGTQPASQPATTAKDLPKAEEIVKAALEAMGGKKAFDDIKSTSIKATMSTPMGDMTLDMKSAVPARFLLLQSFPGMGEMSIGSDGKVGWMNNPMAGGLQLLEGEQLEQMRKQSNMYLIVFNLQEDFKELETVDRIQFNGQDCYKVKMTPKEEGRPTQFGFFSSDSKLMQGMEITQDGPMGQQMTSTISFAEWKPIEKLHLFTKMNIEQAGMQVGMTFTEVEFNKVDPAAFEPPAEVKELLSKKAGESPATQTAPSSGPASRPATTRPAAPSPKPPS